MIHYVTPLLTIDTLVGTEDVDFAVTMLTFSRPCRVKSEEVARAVLKQLDLDDQFIDRKLRLALHGA